MRIALTGGGTGGHIFPILAVVREIKKQTGDKEDIEFLFLGPDGELEREFMGEEFIPIKKVQGGKLRRYFSPLNFLDIFKIPLGFLQSLWQLLVFMPDVLFAKGGYASVPVTAAAWFYRIPILIHESDVVPGLANQFAAKVAKRIAVSFPGSEKFFPERKVFLSGNPIREEMVQGSKEEGEKIFSLHPDKKTILVIGGSQGARVINQAIVFLLPKIIKRWQVIHITGKKEYENVIQEAGKIGIKPGHGDYKAYPFLSKELPHAFAAADLIISRAGAITLTEIAANQKPAIIIPIEGSANKHQEQNAFVFSQAGAAIVLEQANLGENIFFEKIEQALEDKELRFELSERIKRFYNPEAAKIIASELIKIAL
jgi:UDP-N-acetylglucosamine--N-acetylmuramyl-(pentapeptide) pyrophosphoryl-undecaprenol N-acetylglucosamine transferase